MKKIGPIELVLLFAIPGVFMALATRVAIPFLDKHTQLPMEMCWFLSAGTLVLVPLFVAAICFTGREVGSYNIWLLAKRMRVKRLGVWDWAWALGAIGIVGVLTSVMLWLGRFIPGFDPNPEFFPNMPLKPGMQWLVAAWLPFFIFNILGEELWWRGYLLPRQEATTGAISWFINGLFWAAFHLGMGWSPIWLALPNFLILPLVVQVTKNTSVALVIHTVFGVIGFLSLAFGFVM